MKRREWADRVNRAAAASGPVQTQRRGNTIRRKLSGSFTLYGLQRSNSRAGGRKEEEEEEIDDLEEAWMLHPPRCRPHVYVPTTLSTSFVMPQSRREMVSVSLGLGLGRLRPFSMTKPEGRQGRKGNRRRRDSMSSVTSTTSRASRASTASRTSIASRASTTSRTSVKSKATTISRKSSSVKTATDPEAASVGEPAGQGRRTPSTVSAWPRWPVLSALRVFRSAATSKTARDHIHL